jgi:hypothetical protein
MLAVDPLIDLATARPILAFLSGVQPDLHNAEDDLWSQADLAGWLVERELGPLAQVRCRSECPALAERLQGEMYSTAAQNTLHWRNLQEIDAGFAAQGLVAVLLKGAALAETVYDQPEQRTMGDVDLWLREGEMGKACAVMDGLRFTALESSARPLALQALAEGEVQFFKQERQPTMVELHFSPFSGWWLQRTAVIDTTAVWARREPLPGWEAFCQLSAEDTVIHLAVHMAVNHQFGLAALRSLIDIAMTAQARDVAWPVVAQRARQWHLATTVWLVLHLLREMTGMPGLDTVLQELRPSAWRRRQLAQIVSPESLLAGHDIRRGRARFQLLLLLVDHPPDAARLVYRTLWPEKAWLQARYGAEVSPWQHLQKVIREGAI